MILYPSSPELHGSSFSVGLQEGGCVSVGALHGDRERRSTTLGTEGKKIRINLQFIKSALFKVGSLVVLQVFYTVETVASLIPCLI